jgi:hypothetical protein
MNADIGESFSKVLGKGRAILGQYGATRYSRRIYGNDHDIGATILKDVTKLCAFERVSMAGRLLSLAGWLTH